MLAAHRLLPKHCKSLPFTVLSLRTIFFSLSKALSWVNWHAVCASLHLQFLTSVGRAFPADIGDICIEQRWIRIASPQYKYTLKTWGETSPFATLSYANGYDGLEFHATYMHA